MPLRETCYAMLLTRFAYARLRHMLPFVTALLERALLSLYATMLARYAPSALYHARRHCVDIVGAVSAC